METVPQNKMIELANYLQKRKDYKDVKLGYGETLPGDYITGKVHRFQRS